MKNARQKIDDGSWILNRDQDFSPLLDRLNKILTSGRRVVVATTDPTAAKGDQLTQHFETMHSTQPVSLSPDIGGVMSIKIPVGLWIIVPTRSLILDGQSYPSTIDIVCDSIKITRPTIGMMTTHVDYREYAILALHE